MPVTLIGLRGSGKSTVGRVLADRLGRRFVDADEEIERRAGCTIREMFESVGEEAFRELERRTMADLLADDDLVIAAGGGAVLSPETRDRLRRSSGPVVYLCVLPETAVRRIGNDTTTASRRPSLTTLSPLAEMESILRQREPLYRECASLVMDADGREIEELAVAIVESLERSSRRETAT